MDKTRNRLSFILVGGAACITAFAPAIGQQTPAARGATGTGSGLSVTLDYLTTLRYDDNLALRKSSLGSTSRWENRLGLGVVSQTPDSLLTFNLSGLHRFSDSPIIGSDSEFNEPRVRLAYSRNSANSQIAGQAEYRETDLTFNQSLTDINQDGVIDAADIIIDPGTRVTTRAGVTWQVGINDPLGFVLSYNHSKREFRGTTDPNLFDSQSDRYSLATLLRISPVLQGNVTLSYIDYSANDAALTDRQTTTLSTGITYNVSPVTTINASIGVSQVDETLRAIPSNTVDEGFVASFSWAKTLANGAANFVVDQTFGTNGDRTNVQAGRSYVLPRGTFDFSFGVTQGPFGKTTPIGSLNYTHKLPSSQFTAALQRRVSTSTQSVETQQTQASLGYDYFINSVSSASLGVNYLEQANDGTGPSNRRQRANLNASYTHALTKDWDMTVGYQHRFANDPAPGSASGNSIFVSLGRQFVLKP